MTAKRRGVIKAIVTAGLIGGISLQESPVRAAIPFDANLIHHVFFWLKNPGSIEDRAKLIAGLESLRQIEIIRYIHIGVPAPTEKRDVVENSYDVSELMIFDTAADQKSYQDHPIHQAFVAKCEDLWRKVIVYDAVKA